MSVRLSKNDVPCVSDLFRRLYWIQTRPDWTGFDSIRFDSIRFEWIRSDWTRPDHTGLDSITLDQTR